MATKYFVTFKNESTQPSVVQFCVYQQYPDLPGLKSVAWKKAGAYMGGQATVEWVITYSAVLSNYNDEGGIGIYASSQSVGADFKDQFDITDESGIQVVKKSGTSGQDGTITITNKSNEMANVGIGMDDSLSSVIPNVYGGVEEVFQITPTYFVAAYENLELGQLISDVGIIGKPLTLQFPSGVTKATVRLIQDGQKLNLKIEY
ncbi:unnamed protein product [Rhizophagus irregularis]|nr:unnamed protein product [Rhizophagus irregularis]